jgi:hypothetical protein
MISSEVIEMKERRKPKDDDASKNRGDDRRPGKASMCVANFAGRVEEHIL